MDVKKFLAKLPLVTVWIDQTLAENAPHTTPAADFGFIRLACYFSADLLAKTKVAVVEHVPVPPLTALGLPELSTVEEGEANGITLKDTCFLKDSQATDESLHFHELVHAVQWEYLGIERFLLAYAAGLEKHGYRNSPLEVMARELQDYFDRGGQPHNVEALIRSQLDQLKIDHPYR